jgi:HPt (histidine-containing phosphotransfer) domain-containing protein/CheY-like chemotaxis protein
MVDPLRVLLIEENSDESERISSVLESANHDVFPATAFEDASEALLIQKFDAVLVGSSAAAESVAEFAANLRELERSHRSSVRTAVLSVSPQLPRGSGWFLASDDALHGYLPSEFEAAAFSDAVKALARAVPREPVPEERRGSSELPVFDEQQFRAQVAHDPDLFIEIIDLFLAERPDQANEMRAALAACDYDRLSRAAHMIKGSLASLHAPQARARAEELELAARSLEDQMCRLFLAALERDLDTLEGYLLGLRQSSDQS